MKRVVVLSISVLILWSCGQNNSPKANQKDSNQIATSTDTLEMIPGIDKINFSDTVAVQANENMRFDKELFKVKAGKKIKLILKNTEKKSPMSMTHNVVILAKGTDIADFADAVKNAKQEQYVPSTVDALVIAHTKLVAGGDTGEVDFIIPQKGVYDFICSFPGHWGTMQGKIVAE